MSRQFNFSKGWGKKKTKKKIMNYERRFLDCFFSNHWIGHFHCRYKPYDYKTSYEEERFAIGSIEWDGRPKYLGRVQTQGKGPVTIKFWVLVAKVRNVGSSFLQWWIRMCVLKSLGANSKTSLNVVVVGFSYSRTKMNRLSTVYSLQVALLRWLHLERSGYKLLSIISSEVLRDEFLISPVKAHTYSNSEKAF